MMLPVTKWLWNHEFWLPPGFTWEDMKDTDEVRYPQPHHLLFCIPSIFLLIIMRGPFERLVAQPLSRRLGLQEKVQRKPPPNAVLEAFYSKHQKGPEKRQLSGLAKQCDLETRQVERWFRSRLRQDQPSLIKKFCEACWRSFFYVVSFAIGLAVMYDKPWMWDSRECWTRYPQQPLEPSLYVYYIVQLSFYGSLAITLPFDVKRKVAVAFGGATGTAVLAMGYSQEVDPTEAVETLNWWPEIVLERMQDYKMQIIHHAATIFLISFSYCANYIRIGSLVMIIHDASDCFLEPTKMFHYLKWRKICDTLFIVFSIVFLFSRLVIFPNMVLYNTYYYSMELFQPFLGYYLMNGSLIILQLLHAFWSFLIIRMLCRFFVCGTMEKDLRSDSEDSEKGEEEMAEKEVKKNGSVPSRLNSDDSYISKDTPLQLNGSSHPTNSHTKIR